MKNKLKNQLGISTLVLVFIVASLMTLIISVLILVTFLSATRSAQTLHTQKVFFAAEGALYATIQRLKDEPSWTPPDEYQIGDITINTQVSSSNGGVNILVTATLKGTKRTLAGTYGVGEEERTPLDIILVIDHSGSMAEGGCSNEEKCFPGYGCVTKNWCHPFYEVQDAALKFLLHLDDTQDQVGIVGYAVQVINPDDLVELTLDYQRVREKIINFSTTGRTNIASAINHANTELNNNARGEAIKVIIVLSDGVANESIISCSNCGTYPCLRDPSTYLPFEDPFNPPESPPDPANPYVGTCCTDDAIFRAKNAKDKSYFLFSIFLNKVSTKDSGCTIASTMALGGKTLQQIANGEDFYYETTKEEDLEAIYSAIAQEIASFGFFKIWEEVPEPELD